MKTLEQVIDREVVKDAGKKIFKGAAIGTAICAGLFGLLAMALMQLPTC